MSNNQSLKGHYILPPKDFKSLQAALLDWQEKQLQEQQGMQALWAQHLSPLVADIVKKQKKILASPESASPGRRSSWAFRNTQSLRQYFGDQVFREIEQRWLPWVQGKDQALPCPLETQQAFRGQAWFQEHEHHQRVQQGYNGYRDYMVNFDERKSMTALKRSSREIYDLIWNSLRKAIHIQEPEADSANQVFPQPITPADQKKAVKDLRVKMVKPKQKDVKEVMKRIKEYGSVGVSGLSVELERATNTVRVRIESNNRAVDEMRETSLWKTLMYQLKQVQWPAKGNFGGVLRYTDEYMRDAAEDHGFSSTSEMAGFGPLGEPSIPVILSIPSRPRR